MSSLGVDRERDPYYGQQQGRDDDNGDDESGPRTAWEIASWIILVLTLILNVILVGILLVRRNAFTVINKAILTVGILDILYGIFVSPFFVENYVHNDWGQSEGYCKFFVYLFSFHDLFVPLVLILLSTYVSLKFSGTDLRCATKKTLSYSFFYFFQELWMPSTLRNLCTWLAS